MIEKQTKDNTKHINLKVPLDMFEKVEDMARRNQRTVSGQIRFMLDEYIKIKETN